MNYTDLQEIAENAISEYVNNEMNDTFIHILENFIDDHLYACGLKEMLNQAIKNQVEKEFNLNNKFKTLINEVINNKIDQIISDYDFNKRLLNKLDQSLNQIVGDFDKLIHDFITNEFGIMNISEIIGKVVEEVVKDQLKDKFKLSISVRKEESK